MMKYHLYSDLSSFLQWGIVAALCCVLSLTAWPATASAQDVDAQLETYLEEAEEGYDMLYFEEAIEAIQDGIALAERENVRNKLVAELYILLGLIRHADGDDSLAEDAFVQAVENYPDIEVDPFYRTPATEEMMDAARQRARPPADDPGDDPPSPDIDDPPPEDEVDPLTHSPIPRADAGESLVFMAEMPADLPVFRVHLHHRRFGEDDFTQTEMEPTDATGFSFTLPGQQVRTSQLEYFITAIDRSGEVVAESGRRTNPHRVSVLGGTGPTPPDADPDRDQPDVEDPDAPSNTGFFGTLAVGSDIGFLPGGTAPTAHPDRNVSPGVAPAFAHSLLDLGWRVTDNNNIGLYFRWQFVPGQNFDALPDDRYDANASFLRHNDECFGFGLPGDCLLGLKYQRVISTDIPEFYSSAGVGIGRIRNWLQLKQTTGDPDDPNASPDPNCVLEGGQLREVKFDDGIGHYCTLRDTVRTGWFHFGIGGGMFIPISSSFDLVGDTYLMVHFPDTSVNLDVNLGIRFRL